MGTMTLEVPCRVRPPISEAGPSVAPQCCWLRFEGDCRRPRLPAWLSGKGFLPVQETEVQFLGPEDPLKKEMATHSSTLAWRIPWTEDPGGLQSMGSQRVRRDSLLAGMQAGTPTPAGPRPLPLLFLNLCQPGSLLPPSWGPTGTQMMPIPALCPPPSSGQLPVMGLAAGSR